MQSVAIFCTQHHKVRFPLKIYWARSIFILFFIFGAQNVGNLLLVTHTFSREIVVVSLRRLSLSVISCGIKFTRSIDPCMDDATLLLTALKIKTRHSKAPRGWRCLQEDAMVLPTRDVAGFKRAIESVAAS